jgi:hypothetical protein
MDRLASPVRDNHDDAELPVVEERELAILRVE